MKIYVTKYALSTGIHEFDVDETNITPGDYFSWGKDGLRYFINKREWTTDFEVAKLRVKTMIEKRQASLEKQIKSLSRKKELVDTGQFPIKRVG